jgi:malonate decarboxylase gamma subunit
MTLAEILASLFPNGHDVVHDGGVLLGSGPLPDGRRAHVIGVADRAPLGVDEALRLSAAVLDAIAHDDDRPILVLVDSDSQRMSKRDELLGIDEFLAHLAKCLLYADLCGRRTVGLLYGHSAAGAFIATALSTHTLLGLPGASPAVMDLPSMSRVTKLPLDVLQQKATSTPVFAPGLENIARVGAVHVTWDGKTPLAEQVQALLDARREPGDPRDRLGKSRGGRPKAAEVAERVHALALQAE